MSIFSRCLIKKCKFFKIEKNVIIKYWWIFLCLSFTSTVYLIQLNSTLNYLSQDIYNWNKMNPLCMNKLYVWRWKRIATVHGILFPLRLKCSTYWFKVIQHDIWLQDISLCLSGGIYFQQYADASPTYFDISYHLTHKPHSVYTKFILFEVVAF